MALHATAPLREDELHQKDETLHIRVRKLHKDFGANEVRKGVNLNIERGKVSVILGGSCSGKSQKKFPGKLSGGMRKRVGLARALVLQHEILIYEEPTTGLDPLAPFNVDEMTSGDSYLHHLVATATRPQ